MNDRSLKRKRPNANWTRIVKECVVCGASFLIVKGDASQVSTCSVECQTVRRRELRAIHPATKTCEGCGCTYTPPHGRRPKQRFCSMACFSTWSRSRPVRYRANTGYWMVRPAGSGRTLLEHRWVMEQHLGRRLTRREVVHHVNCDPNDNRLENLMLLPDQAAHVREHARLKRQRQPERAC